VRVITATDDAGNSSQITITETGGVNDPRSNAILVKETVGTPLPCGNNADIENTVALPVSESISCLPQGVNNTPDTGYLTYQEGWDTQRGGETPTSYDNNPIPIGSGTEYDFDANGFITYPDFSTGPCPACPATDPGQWNYYQNIIISVYADAALSSLQNKFTFTDASCRHGYYGWYRNGKFSTPQQTEVNLKVYGGTVVATVDNHWPVNCAQSQ
jgi:hypothetical protein